MPKKDVNQTAFMIVAVATGEEPKPDPNKGKNGHNFLRAQKAGLKGGPARAEKLTKKERVEIARKGAKKRWGK